MMTSMHTRSTLHSNLRYLVVGLGLSGYSAARYLLKHGYCCKVQDSREQPPYLSQLQQEFPAVEVKLGELSEEMLSGSDCLVVSPGLSVRSELLQKAADSGWRIMGDIELFAEAVNRPVLAITGSNGKSTVTSLLGAMIAADGKKVGVGGNIGVPALDLLDEEMEMYVLELSSFQLETTHSLKPEVACVLNISEDHMDRYRNFEDYRDTKKSIYVQALHCLSNQDDPLTFFNESDYRFSIRQAQGADFSVIQDGEFWLSVQGEKWLPTSALKLKGRHNWANCLAAMGMAHLAGISRAAIVRVLTSFKGLAHRSEWVAESNGVIWINDSKATNPGAAQAAIEGIEEPVLLIAGGQSKGANVKLLCKTLQQHVKKVFLLGQDAEIMQQAWQGCVDIERVADMEQAVQRAAQVACAGDLVLLSPACASFDMYSGFRERGEHFCRLVRALL